MLEKIKNPGMVVFRPSTKEAEENLDGLSRDKLDELTLCAAKAWDENPDARPTFKEIHRSFRKVYKGYVCVPYRMSFFLYFDGLEK